jgi:hypothetical protein
MSGNIDPIFSKVGDIQGGVLLTTAANDYTGQGIQNAVAFTADTVNGGFLQRLRFKPIGTNVASVARVFINYTGTGRMAPCIAAVTGTPTGTPSASGGTLQSGTYFAKILAVDEYGAITAASTETASVSVTGPTGSIAWAWTAVTGAVKYLVFVGPITGGQCTYFESTTNSFTQTAPVGQRDSPNGIQPNTFYGEVGLPATTLSATAPLVEIDYPMNVPLPPGARVIVGLGTTVAAGWQVTGIGGKY